MCGTIRCGRADFGQRGGRTSPPHKYTTLFGYVYRGFHLENILEKAGTGAKCVYNRIIPQQGAGVAT